VPRPDKRSGPATTPGHPHAADSTTCTASVHGGEVVDLAAWRPSSYSLAAHELAAHIRQLRRQGWQSWEIRARFDYGEAA
jgi:hypothetical protein